MKILEVKTAVFPEIKVIRYHRFRDDRGYFTEIFRSSDFQNHPELPFLKEVKFLQTNESYSKKRVVRGLHSQWNPYMGKLVRTISGHMVDLFLDIRKGSPTFGKIGAYDMPSTPNQEHNEWIWIPVGFAHGNFFLEETTIEYLCTAEYSPENEAGISPMAKDIDWSLCDLKLKNLFNQIIKKAIVSEKDKKGLTVKEWSKDRRSKNFIYGKL